MRSKKAVARLAEHKATLAAMDTQMAEALSNYKITQVVQTSAELMKSMNSLVKEPQMRGTMKNMSIEMMKAGLVSEAIDDSISMAVDTVDTEEKVEEAVQQVLFEITGETSAQAARVPVSREPAVRQQEATTSDDDLMKAIAAGDI